MARCGISSDPIIQGVDSMHTYLSDGSRVVTRSPGIMLDRARFDTELASAARDAGAEVLCSTTCVSRTGKGVLLAGIDGDRTVRPSIIIGADGPRSTVGMWMGSTNTEFVVGAQYTLPLTEPLENTEVYFRHEFHGGYGWLFPKGCMANVGIGVRLGMLSPPGRLDMLLKAFADSMEKAGKVRNTPVSMTGGLIPVGGMLALVKDNMVLVGDAGGLADAMTGGGIPQAVICGRMAGKAAADAVQKQDASILGGYEIKCKEMYGPSLQRAVEKRRLLESCWEELDTMVKKCWVAFGEYYDE